MVLVEHCVPFSPQYGIVLYQNHKIPQQRKTLLSHFSAPVVSFLLHQRLRYSFRKLKSMNQILKRNIINLKNFHICVACVWSTCVF